MCHCSLSSCCFTIHAGRRSAKQARFTLLNRTGLVIQELYVSPDESDDWEEDVLGRDVLKHGESLDITFSRTEKSCDWDLKIKDEDGDEIEWDSLDLCAASHITLLYQNNKPTAIIK